jgi:hypothetical protein
MKFKHFQQQDYARGALHNGFILAHDPGLGKTIAGFTIPMLWVGFHKFTHASGRNGVGPKGSVLIVQPGDLHDQTIAEAATHFRAEVMRLDSQETFYRLAWWVDSNGRRRLPPGS